MYAVVGDDLPAKLMIYGEYWWDPVGVTTRVTRTISNDFYIMAILLKITCFGITDT